MDSIARDGTLARCDRDPAAAQTDIECANARRAALAVQLEEERARRSVLERESAAKIEALRREFDAQRARAAAAAAAEQAEEQALLGASPTLDVDAAELNALVAPVAEDASDRRPARDTAESSGAAAVDAGSGDTVDAGVGSSVSATSSSSTLTVAP